MSNRFSRAGLLLLTAWLALLVLAMVRTTLALPYLSDDFEHGQLIAQIRAGTRAWPRLDRCFPFHGQTLVLLRLIFWFGTLAGSMSLTWVRIGICAAHIAGAVGCAILCTRWTGSKLAGFVAGTLYAGRARVHRRTNLVAIERDFLFGCDVSNFRVRCAEPRRIRLCRIDAGAGCARAERHPGRGAGATYLLLAGAANQAAAGVC